MSVHCSYFAITSSSFKFFLKIRRVTCDNNVI